MQNDVMIDPGTGPVIVTKEVIAEVKKLSPEKWGILTEKEIATMVGKGVKKSTEYRVEERFPKQIKLSLTPPAKKQPHNIPLGLAWSVDGIVINLRDKNQGKITRA